MAFRELRATGILNCTVIMHVDISMFITFANWPLNVCELTSTRLRTDQRRLWNDRWRNDRLPFWPVPQDSQLKILKIAQNILYIYIYIYIYNIFWAILRILSWLSWGTGQKGNRSFRQRSFHKRLWSVRKRVEVSSQTFRGQFAKVINIDMSTCIITVQFRIPVARSSRNAISDWFITLLPLQRLQPFHWSVFARSAWPA